MEDTTKNGINFTTPITIDQITVTDKDDLTNNVTKQAYFAAKQNKVLITKP